MKGRDCLIFFGLILVFCFPVTLVAKTIPVSPGKKIQDAINQAKDGDIVEVSTDANWVYTEALRITNKTNLKVVGKELPKIKFVFEVGEKNESVVTIQGQNITFEGFKIESEFSPNCNKETAGITVLQNSSAIYIKNNEISKVGHDYTECEAGGNSYGIKIKDTDDNSAKIQNIHIEDNILHHLQLGRSETIAINGDVLDFWVERNTIHDVDNIAIDAIGFEDRKNFQATDGKVIGNKVYKLVDNNPGQRKAYPFIAGIYIDGGTQVRVERNIVYEFGIGISVGSEGYRKSVKDINVVSNIIFKNIVAEILIGKFEEIAEEDEDIETQRGFVKNCKILNNTIISENDGRKEGYAALNFASGKICDKSGECKTDADLTPNLASITFANNIVLAKGFKLVVGVTGDNKKFHSKKTVEFKDPDVKFFNNLFWQEKSLGEKDLIWNWNKVPYEELSAFETALKGRAASNIFVNPNFAAQNEVNKCSIIKDLPNVIIFQLGKNSPAINYGVNSYYPELEKSKDFCGSTRLFGDKIDTGAFEYQ